jgi:hypothetical protein
MRERSAKGFAGLINEERGIVAAHYTRGGDRVTTPPIAIGSRFRMSARGAARSPRTADKEGVIVGGGRHSNSVRAPLDGHKSPITLHRDYIEQIPSDDAEANILTAG